MPVVLMILGFIWWWPLGLLILGYLIMRRKHGCWSPPFYAGSGPMSDWNCHAERWEERLDRKMARMQEKMQRVRDRMESYRSRGGWGERRDVGQACGGSSVGPDAGGAWRRAAMNWSNSERSLAKRSRSRNSLNSRCSSSSRFKVSER